MEARLREPLPEHGQRSARWCSRPSLRDVLAPGLRIDHPRFFAFVPGPGNPVGVLADALAAGFSVFAGAWLASPGAAMVELVVLDWLRERLRAAGDDARAVRQRRLDGQPDRARRRAGGARRQSSARARRCTSQTRRIRSVERALRVAGRPPRPRARRRSRPAAGARRARRRGRGRPGGRAAAGVRRRHRRHDRHRRRRSARQSCGASATSTDCGCTSTARTARPRCCRRTAARSCAGSSWPTR